MMKKLLFPRSVHCIQRSNSLNRKNLLSLTKPSFSTADQINISLFSSSQQHHHDGLPPPTSFQLPLSSLLLSPNTEETTVLVVSSLVDKKPICQTTQRTVLCKSLTDDIDLDNMTTKILPVFGAWQCFSSECIVFLFLSSNFLFGRTVWQPVFAVFSKQPWLSKVI